MQVIAARTLCTLVVAFAVLSGRPSASSTETPPESAGGPGRIIGTVGLTSSVARPPAVADYVSRRVGVRPPAAGPEIRNVVVYVDGAAPPAELPTERAAIRQIAETFVPRVVTVTRGSTVDFPNDDPFFHSVFSLSHAARFNLGRYAHGDSRSRTFDETGIVKLFCDLHSYMNAIVLVFDNPYFATPDDDGRFVIEGVPAGTHRVVAWHERVGASRRAIVVESGVESRVEFSLPVLDP